MRTSEWFIVIDTETADSVKRPLPYDIGYKIVNRKGEIAVARSFVVYEIFVGQKEMMKSAYYANKIPQYEEDLKRGGRKLVRLYTARKQILDDIENYKISAVYAYNVGFDHRALNNDQAFTTNNRYRYFFPYGTEFRCIWNMACQVLLARPSYIKYAKENNFISEKGNILTNAECCYRYLTRNPNFQEEHKGLEDVSIEIEILLACYKQHQKMDTKPYTACWRLVQKKREEMEAAQLGAVFRPGARQNTQIQKRKNNDVCVF